MSAANTTKLSASKPKKALQRQPTIFTGRQAREIGKGFSTAITEQNYTALACAVLPDHVHLVLAWHSRDAKKIIGHLKTRATQSLTNAALHPFAYLPNPPTPWSEGGWAVFLFTPADMRHAIQYVENNPLKENEPRQHRSFITPYQPPPL